MELTEENIISLVKPYLENCACLGRDAYGEYIEKMAKGIAKNILEMNEKCLRCNGKGYIEAVRHESGSSLKKQCDVCNGKGEK